MSKLIQIFSSRAKIDPEPLGDALTIDTWNYLFSLIIVPLIDAIVTGNCVIVKQSEIALRTSKIVTKLIKETFPPEYTR